MLGNLVYDRIRRKSTIMDPVTNKPVMLPGVLLCTLRGVRSCDVFCLCQKTSHLSKYQMLPKRLVEIGFLK